MLLQSTTTVVDISILVWICS